VAGVLLFAMAYFLGSAVSRIAQDFFNDDDLGMRVTEDNIRGSVYCQPSEQSIVMRSLKSDRDQQELSKSCKGDKKYTVDIFHLQESSLLLVGKTRPRDFVSFTTRSWCFGVLRFDGLIAVALCLFVCARGNGQSAMDLGARAHDAICGASYAVFQHVKTRGYDNPPFMEFTLYLLSGAGGYVLLRGTRRTYRASVLVSLLLFGALAFLGWWWTEVLYDHLVIHSFYALKTGGP